MTRLEQISWPETSLASPFPNSKISKEIAKLLGFEMSIIPYLSPVPWMAWSMTTKIQPVAHISNDLANLITLVVSMENSCRHCYGAIRSTLKLMGFSERQIIRLEEDLYQSELNKGDKMMLAFARKIVRSNPRPDLTDLENLSNAGFSRLAVIETAYVATNTVFSNRIATLLAIPPDSIETLEKNRMIRFFSPIVHFGVRSFNNRAKNRIIKRYRHQAEGLENSGFGAKLVEALAGSPTSYVLKITLNDAWQSPYTSQRTKALIFVIIAHALECSFCAGEACLLLKKEGWLQQDIDHLLTYLNSDKLSPFESKLVHFARDSISYQVKDIQGKAHEFSRNLDKEVIIEVCGLIALANWVARLSIILSQWD